jgi:hypothetical protein
MNKFSLLFLTNCFLLIILSISAENLTETEVRSVYSINIENMTHVHYNNLSEEYNELKHHMDDNEEEDEIEKEEEDEEEEEDNMMMSEGEGHNLDNTISEFFESGVNMISEINKVFNEELNHTNTESKKNDIWIAYSNSWNRVMESLMKEITRKILDSNGDIHISINCVRAMIAITSGLRKQKSWPLKCKST